MTPWGQVVSGKKHWPDGTPVAGQQFTYGFDDIGNRQSAGAGGVGGLISMRVHVGTNAGTYFCSYDGNGNTTPLVNATNGATAAHYEYGPFGELLRATGPMAKINPFRFSTKYDDDESDFLYYGRRYYNPAQGRWIGRDHIGEQGGLNLFAFVANNAITQCDLFGEMLEGTLEGEGMDAEMEGTEAAQGADAISQAESACDKTFISENNELQQGLKATDTWGRPNTLAKHFTDHGADFGAGSEEEYADMASKFLQDSQQAGLETRIDSEGVIRVYDPNTGTFGSYNANGTTRTFFKPSSPNYWSRRAPGFGAPAWTP
jgi:RHS repeat-associated protein